MKRDPDLSRLILLFVEEHAPAGGPHNRPLQLEDYDQQTVLAHAELLIEEGLLDGKVLKGLGGIVDVAGLRLCASGHQALHVPRSSSPAGFPPGRGFYEQWFDQEREAHDIAARTATRRQTGAAVLRGTPPVVEKQRNNALFDGTLSELMLQAAVTVAPIG